MRRATALAQLVEEARWLAEQDRVLEARDTYLVAADGFEELGTALGTVAAKRARLEAKRMHVVLWAREHVDPAVRSENVITWRRPPFGMEAYAFLVQARCRQTSQVMPVTATVLVRVEPDGRVIVLP